jgi:glycerol-3-phosphate dehydrogenase
LTAAIRQGGINGKYLPGISLPDSILAVSTFAEAIRDETRWLVAAVPSGGLAEVIKEASNHVRRPLGVIRR